MEVAVAAYILTTFFTHYTIQMYEVLYFIFGEEECIFLIFARLAFQLSKSQ